MGVAATGRGLIELTRPVNAIAAGLLTFVGAFVAGGVSGAPWAVVAAVVATISATGAGNAINDYFDREIDRINDPHRPIPRGDVEPTVALGFSLALFAVAIAIALTLPLLAIVIAVINLVALISYTNVFKGLPGAGNVLVAYLGGSTFLFGGAAVGTLNVTVGTLFALAALSTIAREIIKDVEDIEGDREEGLNTLPMAIGPQRALHVATGTLALAIVLSPLPYVQGTLGVGYLAVVAPAVVVMAVAAVRSYTDPTTGQTQLKYGMFLAAIAFVIGRGSLLV